MKKRILILLVAAFALAITPVLIQGCGTPSKTVTTGDKDPS